LSLGRRAVGRTAARLRRLGRLGLVGLGLGVWGTGCADTDTVGGRRLAPVSRGATAVDGSETVGRPAPELAVERLDGGNLALSSLRGKVVLLDVWASWCGPCKQELPMLDEISARLKRRGVEIVAVSVDQDRANLRKFLRVRPRWSLTVAHDPAGAVADTFQPDKMPTSYAIDRRGVVRYVNSGFEPTDAPAIEARLTELAGE